MIQLWGEYFASFLQGLLTTVEITVCGLVVAVTAGGLLAICRMAPVRALRILAAVYIDVVRATPTLVVLFLAYFGLGEVGVLIPAFWAAVLGLGLFYAALFAEIFRGGVEGIEPGQRESAEALGMSTSLRLRKVILPQALRAILLPSTNSVADFIKDTSLVVVIGVSDLTSAASQATAVTYQPMDMYLLAALMYFCVYLLISRVLGRWEIHAGSARH